MSAETMGDNIMLGYEVIVAGLPWTFEPRDDGLVRYRMDLRQPVGKA
jgi:hypothetical protein